MPISKKLLKKLEEAKVAHEVVGHKKVFTALDVAATLKVKLEQVVKSLLVKAGKDHYLALLPANKNLDFKKLAKVLGVDYKKVSIPKERVMADKFKVKPGAMSAFGSFHKIPVVIDSGLVKAREAIFSSGSFVESIRMKVKDYLNLENPVVGSFGAARKVKSSPPSLKLPPPQKLRGTGRRAGKPKVKKRGATRSKSRKRP